MSENLSLTTVQKKWIYNAGLIMERHFIFSILNYISTVLSAENVALRGRATQSKQFNHQLADANNGIDGNRESDYYTGSCAFSEKQTNPWWRVDLLDSYIVTSVTITNHH